MQEYISKKISGGKTGERENRRNRKAQGRESRKMEREGDGRKEEG